MKIILVISTKDFSKKITQKTFSALLTKKNQSNPFFSPPLRSQNHMKKAQRHHDYLSSE